MSGRTQSRFQVLLGRYGAFAALASLAVLAEGAALGGCGAKSSSPSPTNAEGTGATAQATAPAHASNGMVKLERGAHPMALPKYDIGTLDATKRIEDLSIFFKLSPAQQADHDALLVAQLDPASPSYHKWLTPETYAARFGAKPADIARTRDWLASKGFDVKSTSRLGARVMFGGTVAQLQDAFQTEMHRYQVGGETHYAMATAPSIPADLADVVLGIHNTHDFYPRHAPVNLKPAPTPMGSCTGSGCTNAHGIAPPDWATLYDVPATNDGAGVDIVVVGVAQIAQSDISAFRTLYSLPASTVDMVLVPDTGPAVGANGAGLEAILDTEWSGGIAKAAKIHYVYVGSTSGNVDEATFYAIEQNIAPVLSESFGGCEFVQGSTDADVLAALGSAANLQGITYLASSGDDGAAGCADYGLGGLYVNTPAAYPGVTAVGGTEFPTGSLTFNGSGFVTAYPTATEEVWNESSASAPGSGGGGISYIFSRPSYQTALATCTPASGSLPAGEGAGMRQVPDVSFTSALYDNGIIIECTFDSAANDCLGTGGTPTLHSLGGTSASSPAFSGVVALLNQATGTRLGNINPLLYQLATSAPTAFHDIQLGNNVIPCKAGVNGCPASASYGGYDAAKGYDCASGLGSIDVGNLITAWSALTPTTTTLDAPTTTTPGASVTLTAHITGTGSTAIGGTVTFGFKSYLTNGEIDNSWTLGTANITGGSTTAGTATLASVAIPPGLIQNAATGVDVVAEYGGDPQHLASTSALTRIKFPAALDFCIQPAVATVAPGAVFLYAAAQGTPPYTFYLAADTTAIQIGQQFYKYSTMNGAELTVGTGQPGYVIVGVLDSLGAETFSELTVGAGGGIVPWEDDAGIAVHTCPFGIDAGPLPEDAGPDSATSEDGGPIVNSEDSGPVTTADGSVPTGDSGPIATSDSGPTAGGEDAGASSPTTAKGCSCTTTGRDDGAPAGMLGGVVLGLGLIARRRRRSGN